MRAIVVALGLALTGAAGAETQETSVFRGFRTGNSYLQMTQGDKLDYVMGMVDALGASPILGASNWELQKIFNCVKTKTNYQLVAIVDIWLRDNPSAWDSQMGALFITALQRACRID